MTDRQPAEQGVTLPGEAEGTWTEVTLDQGHGTEALAYEHAEGARTLDPLAAYDREAERMRLAGPRGSSMLNPNWEPPYVPYVAPPVEAPPAQRIADLRARLGSTVRVTGSWVNDGRDWLVDGSAQGVLPRPTRPSSKVKNGVKVPPLGKEQRAEALGPTLRVSVHPEVELYWEGTWSASISEDKAMKRWHPRAS